MQKKCEGRPENFASVPSGNLQGCRFLIEFRTEGRAMYIKENKAKLSFDNFYMPFGGHLQGDNRWVKSAEETGWVFIDDTSPPCCP